MFSIENFLFIKLKFNNNQTIIRNEIELTLKSIINNKILYDRVLQLQKQYGITETDIYTVMYGKNYIQIEDEELFLLTNKAFYGISFHDNNTCKYIVVRDNIRIHGLHVYMSYYFQDIWPTIKSIIEPVYEIQYRIFDKEYQWNIYYVIKNALLLNAQISNLIKIIQYIYKDNLESKKYIDDLSIYLLNNNYKLSMIGFSKKYTDENIILKVFLSKN